MHRKFFRNSIQELESTFEQSQADALLLQELLDELSFRSTERSGRLRRTVQAQLDSVRNLKPVVAAAAKPSNPVSTQPSASEPPSMVSAELSSLSNPRAIPTAPSPLPIPPMTSLPEQILSAWTALEVLSPPSFVRPEDLAGGDRKAVASFEDSLLPWERGEKSRPNYRLYYQIILGSIEMEPAVARLIERYGDQRLERPSVRGQAILASIMVDRSGRVVESPAITMSSFGWGVMTALNGHLADLSAWPEVEDRLVQKLENQLLGPKSDDGVEEAAQQEPLTKTVLLKAYQMLLMEFGLPPEIVRPPTFAIRSYAYFKDSNPPEALLLNSFFLGDLALGRRLLSAGQAPANLKRYLGQLAPKQPCDLLQDQKVLEEIVSPARTPLSRWPGPNRHPLVLLQQAAVNIAFDEAKNGGLLGINGPPGTGKTTLLRDIVAGVIADRAEAMVKFNDPETAFEHSGEKMRAGEAWLHMYRVAESLRGFEMVVASSNNKAVENVSAELPGLHAIASDAQGLRYFKPLSNKMHATETWGMIAAVLGNAQNRSKFKQTFWWDEEVGMSNYLAAAVGTPRMIQETDSVTGQPISRLPKMVVEEKPPLTHEEALRRWRDARTHFVLTLKKSREYREWLSKVRDANIRLETLRAAESDAQQGHIVAEKEVQNKNAVLHSLLGEMESAETRFQLAGGSRAKHNQSKPGFFARLFRTKQARAWVTQAKLLQTALLNAGQVLARLKTLVQRSQDEFNHATEALNAANVALTTAISNREKAENILEEARKKHNVVIADAAFFNQEHSQKQRATPWFPLAAQQDRDEVFIAAMEVHRAFIDAAAKPLRHNLGVLMNVFSSQALSSESKQLLLPHLWSSLFLVVPLVSTTFASVERMFGRLPPEALGWLLIDEAGQALPQAAVGALIRTHRAVVVGDPLQIEPVVLLPETLTSAICRQLGVDPDRFSAPAGSVQTLADASSSYTAEFPAKVGSRTVGVPLLVHRRCEEPMFSISNFVAYSNLMVGAKMPKRSAIRDLLGPSRWIHIQGLAEDKWCADEGAEVIRLLSKLAEAKIPPNLYIITPFVIVADRLRQMVRDSGLLEGWGTNVDSRKWPFERIGTLHTVQGREAEAIIFVLGAPSQAQTGARNWAGGRPNLLNVAVTRAQEVLYVVGNRELWREAGLFSALSSRLP